MLAPISAVIDRVIDCVIRVRDEETMRSAICMVITGMAGFLILGKV